MLVRQKLSTILENNVFAEKWSPEFIFLNEKKKNEKILLFFDIKSSILALFEPSFIYRIF